MHTPDSKILTKAQRHRLLEKMKQDSIRFMGEPSASDELLALLEPIEDFISAEIKATKSRNPKMRARAERRMLEIGELFIGMMGRLSPIYMRTMWKIEHALKEVQSAAS